MLNLNDVVSGLEIAKAKGFEDTRFNSVIEHGNLEDLVVEYGLTDLIAITSEYGDGYIAFDNNNCFQISISKSSYQGVITLSYTLKGLTLNGLAYFSKQIVNLNSESKSLLNKQFNAYLKEAGLNANAQDLAELAIYEPQFDVYLLNFDSNDVKWWLTFRSLDSDFKILSKITKKPNGIKVKSKVKKLNINII